MMIELTKSGVNIDLDKIPAPESSHDVRWLKAFQSFGFLLAVPSKQVPELTSYFKNSHLSCAEIGTFNNSGKINIHTQTSSAMFWDIHKEQLTNMGKAPCKDYTCPQ